MTNENEQYHASPNLSWSKLRLWSESVARYRARYIDRTLPHEQTPALLFGSLVDCLATEPHMFSRTFHVILKCDRRTKAGKDKHQSELVLAKSRDVTLVDEELVNRAEEVASKVRPWLPEGERQKVFEREYEDLRLQCKYDIWRHDDHPVDLKTTANLATFSVMRWGYHLQDAFYRLVSGGRSMLFVVVETRPPYKVGRYILDAELQGAATAEVMMLIDRFRRSRDAGFPERAQSIETIRAPGWYLSRIEAEMEDHYK